MNGSEKQIKWATNIKNEAIANFWKNETLEKLNGFIVTAKNKENTKKIKYYSELIELVNEYSNKLELLDDAATIIDLRDDFFSTFKGYGIKEHVKNAIYYFEGLEREKRISNFGTLRKMSRK